MGCARYWRKCPQCGENVHMNFYCTNCGGDPWGKRREIEITLNNLILKESRLVQDLEKIRKAIIKLNNDIATIDQKKAEAEPACKH